MKIKIITDSTADLSPELLEKYDIAVVPLYVVMGDKTQKDGLEVSPEDIYAHVEKTGKHYDIVSVLQKMREESNG